MSNIIHQDQIAAGPEHISQELGQFSHITEQKQLSEAPHLLQGHFVKYDTSGVTSTCHTHFWDVDTVVGENICCCYSAVISFRLSRSKDESMFQCLPPACSTWEPPCALSGCLSSCDWMTPYALLSLKHQFNSQLLAYWLLTATRSLHSSGYLAVHMAVFPSLI